MQVVDDEAGTRYIVVKRSAESSLVRNPESGESKYLPNEELSAVEGVSPLEVAARAISDPTRRIMSATHSDQALGLLIKLDTHGPIAVRTMMEYGLCESDLLGTLSEFQAAGLITEATIAGERGYELTSTAREGLATLR
jgi:hypothetical protein